MRMTRRQVLATTALAGSAASGCAPGARDAPAAEYIEVEGLRLHYRIAGKGPKAVAIHGASGNLRDWTMGPAEALGESNTLLMFDRPGMGFSERPGTHGASPFVQARLMREAAARLGFERPLLIGHSYGGAVALAWAVAAPETVRGMMLLSAPSQVWDGGVGVLYDLVANPVSGPVLSRILPAIATDGMIGNAIERIFAPQEPPPDYAARVGARLALRPATLRANAADLERLKGYLRRMTPDYPSLKMPTELLHGTADEVVPLEVHSEKLAAQMPAANLTRLEGIGHMPHHVATDAVAAALRRLNARV